MKRYFCIVFIVTSVLVVKGDKQPDLVIAATLSQVK